MKLKYTITLLIIGLVSLSYGQTENSLIPVYENNLWGFIDEEGEYVIKPRYHSVGTLSSNLIPVREGALYGYINSTGKLIIPPKYDFALPFVNDLAKVYIKGKPFFINKKGKILFTHDFIEFHDFENRNTTFALAQNQKYAVVNKSGKIIIEPVFYEVSRFSDGLAIVKMPTPDDEDILYGVIDEEGEYVVDFGEYDEIEPYTNGYAKVSTYDPSYPRGKRQGVIDENGELVLTIPKKDWSISKKRHDFTEDLAIVDLTDKNIPDSEYEWLTRKPKMGIINSAGELILEGENIEEITYFHYNRAFVREGDDKWFLIDKKGNIIDSLPGGLLENKTGSDEKSLPFLNGIEILETPKGLIVIDTTGTQLYPPRFLGRAVKEKKRGEHNLLLYKQKVQLNTGHELLWGFWDLETNKLTKAKFKQIDGFTPNGLIHAVKGNDDCVVDRTGRVVWIQRNKNNKVSSLNIDYMLNGYFYAQSTAVEKKEFNKFGGNGVSGELPIKNTKKHKFPENRFSLLIRTNERTPFKKNIAGYKVYIANSSRDTIYFKAKDSRLEMVLEALNENGQWKNIEYLPPSFCAHSYHTLYLPPNHNWELKAPQYTGAFKTKLRVKLVYKISLDSNETAVIYSNEFTGSINPAQFWRREGI